MPGTARKSALLITAITSIALLAGCGENRSNLVPGDTAERIDAELALVGQLFRSGQCFEALKASEEVRSDVEALGSDVDSTLRRNLLDGVTQLQIKVQDDCVQADSEPEAEPLVPEATPEEPGSDTEPERGSTGATGDDGGTNQPEPEPAPEPEPVPTPPDGGSGGVGPPTGGGVAPPTGGA